MVARQGPGKKAQHGIALLVLLAFFVMGGLAWFLGQTNRLTQTRVDRDTATAASLAQAKKALIAYAVTYGDTHPGQTPGYLPCPDMDNDGSSDTCGNKGEIAIGRLPYRTLGLPDLRDANGECLWYVVSGSFKNNPDPDNLNWDSIGQLDVKGVAGETLASATDPVIRGAAATVVAPGPPIASQSRTTGGASKCGDAVGPTFWSRYPNYVDGSYTLPGTAASIKQGSSEGVTNNDLLTWITPHEIFLRIKRRSDFSKSASDGGHLNKTIDAVHLCLEAEAALPAPNPGTTYGAKSVGRVPGSLNCSLYLGTFVRYWENWKDQFWYAVCAPHCLQVNGRPCDGALLFSGERGANQTRPSSSPTDYLEGDNLSAFASGTAVFSGLPEFPRITDPNTPVTADVVVGLKCL